MTALLRPNLTLHIPKKDAADSVSIYETYPSPRFEDAVDRATRIHVRSQSGDKPSI
jgi:hypothetical protein